MKKHFLLATAIVLTLTGCSTFEEFTAPAPAPAPKVVQTKTIEYMESSARVLEADHKMLVTPVIADLEVSNTKIQYTEREMFANLEVTHALLSNISELKKIALSRAARAHKADVLLGATIDVVTKDGRLEITVSGYPAHYVKFRKAVNSDVELLNNVHSIKTVDGANVVNSPKTTLNIKKVEQAQ